MISRALAERPGEVVVTTFQEDDATILEVRVAPEDLGRIIGRNGRVAHALRALAATTGMKLRKRVILEIVE